MKRNKKKLMLSIAVILVFVPLLYSYFSYYTIKVNNKYADEFYQDLVEVVKKKSDFDMKDVVRFDWDRMIVFYPYTSREEMEKVIGQKWTTYSYVGYFLIQKSFIGDHPLDDDSFNKLVFLKGEEVVLDVTFNRNEVDLTQIMETIYKEESQFIVDNNKLRHLNVNKKNYNKSIREHMYSLPD